MLGNSNLFYTGISYDNCYFIIVNDVTVGILYVSEISDVEKTSLYIEWNGLNCSLHSEAKVF